MSSRKRKRTGDFGQPRTKIQAFISDIDERYAARPTEPRTPSPCEASDRMTMADFVEKNKIEAQRRGRREAKLNSLIPEWCKIPPRALYMILWYGIVQYKDSLTGEQTETVFDTYPNQELDKLGVGRLGKKVRDDLFAQLPEHLSRGRTGFQAMNIMVKYQIEQIERLEHLARRERVESPTSQEEVIDDSENEMAEKSSCDEGIEVKEETHYSSDDEDDDDDVVAVRELFPEPSADPEPPPTRYTPIGIAYMPDRVFHALNAVRAQISRAVKADW